MTDTNLFGVKELGESKFRGTIFKRTVIDRGNFEILKDLIQKDEYDNFIVKDNLELKPIDLTTITIETKIQKCINLNSDSLDLSNLNLEKIPSKVFELSQLKNLRLTNNRISVIPEEISSLISLEFLGLNYNLIRELPASIGNLTTLKSLDLFNNKIEYLPISLAKLTNLHSLHLGFNRLDTIPKEIFSILGKLKGLDIQSNPFKDSPIFNELDLLI